jgi:hypothetical protein
MAEFKFNIPNIDESKIIAQSKSQAGQDLFVVAMLQGAKNKTFLEMGGGCCVEGNNTFLLETQFNYSGVSIDLEDGFEYYPKKMSWLQFYNSVKDQSWPTADSIDDLPNEIQHELRDLHGYEENVPKLPERVITGNYRWNEARPKTTHYVTDAMLFDYSKLVNYFDYLQIDIDPSWNNWLLLEKLTGTKEFAVITFEHNIWTKTTESYQAKKLGLQLLQDLGYTLLADNVTVAPGKGSSINDEPIYFEDWYVNPKYVDKKIIDCYRCIGEGHPKYYTKILFK